MEKEKTIKETLEELTNLIKEDKVKKKKWKYPPGKKVGKSQRKKNYVTVVIPYENGTCDFQKYQIKDQVVWHDMVPRLASAGHTMFDKKGNPVIILPNWSVEPFSPLQHYQQSLIDGTNSKGYKILMAAMQSEKVDAKKPVPNWIKWAGGAVIIGIIIFALLSGDGGGA